MRLRLTKAGRVRMLRIRAGIAATGKAKECPKWSEFANHTGYNCDICYGLLPAFRREVTSEWPLPCPCFVYSRRHLLRVIDRVLKGEVKLPKEGKP